MCYLTDVIWTLVSVILERNIARFFCQQLLRNMPILANTLTPHIFAYIILLLPQLQWEDLTNVTTSIHHIRRRVCEKRENNPRQSIGGKMLTIPQTMWKSITNPATITHTPHNTIIPLITCLK